MFVCRRGCNTRTTTYTEEFVWEDIYHGKENIDSLVDLIKRETKATRKSRQPKAEREDKEYTVGRDGDADEAIFRTPKKPRAQGPSTPTSKRRTPGKAAAGTPLSARKIREKKALEFTPLGSRILSPGVLQSSPVPARPQPAARGRRTGILAVPRGRVRTGIFPSRGRRHCGNRSLHLHLRASRARARPPPCARSSPSLTEPLRMTSWTTSSTWRSTACARRNLPAGLLSTLGGV